MNLEKFDENKIINIKFYDGQEIKGKPYGYTSEQDNDEGAYLLVIPIEGKLKGKYVQCMEDEVVNVEVIE
ncbi:hypothetical protein FC40_GL000485 [Ligilactobacillus hayakitensis DSM 18933 = JCM 14209]|uniref:Uncharacterized protein n=1 Tax=Ligilactobacillus hayakitensis DSM 18933 = JCM 14209 TaxID=1423755 RepID=A0A0R1WMU7_9LACO|nr:hypothetical protein [Ligilactobacillus hayakitensis]KRM19191.1 hypothetical protein FC40_GL000485 [Ligilactobacillus hayakitensis DSM 18933 = JCM 14209]